MSFAVKSAPLNNSNVGLNDLHNNLNHVINNKRYSNNNNTKQNKDDNLDYSTTYGDNIDCSTTYGDNSEMDDLQTYYYGSISVYNYKNLLYNITIPVYKNLPHPLDWDTLTTIYYDCNSE